MFVKFIEYRNYITKCCCHCDFYNLFKIGFPQNQYRNDTITLENIILCIEIVKNGIISSNKSDNCSYLSLRSIIRFNSEKQTYRQTFKFSFFIFEVVVFFSTATHLQVCNGILKSNFFSAHKNYKVN
ncbi:Motile sperm domain-containing protein 2 [Sarcoptes scabiei]|nr:Motile sperm domain-containing protein 2 [Sarcoptes scabiei]